MENFIFCAVTLLMIQYIQYIFINNDIRILPIVYT